MLAGQTSDDPAIRALVTNGGGLRKLAAADRAVAASDRKRASADRRQAAADRRQAQDDLQSAHFDSLTGVYMRDFGRVSLQEAIDRSRSSAEPFVLAFVDVDGLKELNDSKGHAAGDALLQTVGSVLQSKLRRGDPIARVGGDEFLCGLTNTELEVSQLRFEEIRAAVEHAAATASITVGLASLGASDTLEDITARADIDMYARKPRRTRGNNH
jgi:diguanylate cyclase (GGDEF)-like protein